MKVEVNKVKIVVMVPIDYLEIVRDAMCQEGAEQQEIIAIALVI